jgi:hypothetical protein
MARPILPPDMSPDSPHGGSYQRIPLEINAYQLDAEYTRIPKRQFAVEKRVQA